MKNNVFSLKIFIFWKIFIRADKIEIKSVQNCALKIFSFENFDFWDFLFLFRRLRVTLGAMRHSWEVILCGLKITNHSIWDMIDKISRTQKKVDGRLTSYSWAPLIIQYTVFSLFYVQVNQVSRKIPLFRRERAHPVGLKVWSWKDGSWKDWSWKAWSWKDWSSKDWNDSSASYRFQHKTFQLLNFLQQQASDQRFRSKRKTVWFTGLASRS